MVNLIVSNVIMYKQLKTVFLLCEIIYIVSFFEMKTFSKITHFRKREALEVFNKQKSHW